jgi:hypothetical protein
MALGPWYRSARNSWYFWRGSDLVPLGKHPPTEPPPKKRGGKWHPPAVILQEYHRVLAEAPKPKVVQADGLQVVKVLDDFLDWVQRNRAEDTFDYYKRRFVAFKKYLDKKGLGLLPVSEFRPFHVLMSGWRSIPAGTTASGAGR